MLEGPGEAKVLILALLLSSWVTLGKLHNLSEPVSIIYKMGIIRAAG